MKVLLIHFDGKMPNLALMVASAHHKAQGDEVGFHVSDPNLVYVSCIFEKNLPQAWGLPKFYPDANVLIGGPALGKPNELPFDTDIMPDYGLYGIDFSMGFTSRGCIRSCPWCVVPRLEGDIREGTPIEIFHNPDHKKIILLDNNLLASPTWMRTLEYLIEKRLKVNFSQGLDIRLVDEEKAELLSGIPAYGWTFKTPMYHFAWDLPELEDDVRRGVELLKGAGIRGRRLMFYVLTGFNTSHEQDLYRVKKLLELGVDPYVMVYNDRRDDRFIQHLERWVNGRIYKKCRFDEYSRLSRGLRQEVKDISRTMRVQA